MTYIRTIILSVILALCVSQLYAQEEEEGLDIDSLKALTTQKRSDSEMMELYYTLAYKVVESDLDFAHECCDKAIYLSHKLKKPITEVNAYRCLSTVYEYNDELDSALDCNFRALQIIDSVQTIHSLDTLKHLRSRCFNTIGSMFANSGQLSEAIDYFYKALEDNDTSTMPDVYNNLGLISGMNQVYNVAIEHFEQAKSIAKKNGDSAAVTNANFMMATVYIDTYENKKDVSALMLAVKLADELYDQQDLDIYTQMNFSVALPLIYIDAYNYYKDVQGEEKPEYLYKAEKLNNEGLERDIEFYNDDLLSTKVKILVTKGDYRNAGKALKAIKGTYSYLESAPTYFMAIHDYEHALEAKEEANKVEHQDFSLEYTVIKSEKLFAQKQYEDRIIQMDKETQRRDLLFNEQNSRSKLRNVFMSVIVVIGFVIVTYIVMLVRKTNKDNRLLKKQNETIASRNAELISNSEEVMAQYEEISSQSKIIEEQKDDLKSINKNLLASIKYASRIQRAAVTQTDTLKDILHDVFVYWQPLEIVSGDYYWAMENDGIKYLIVADSTGHGVPGALVSILGISLLNDLSAHIHDIHDSAEFLNQFKDKFLGCIKNIDDGMDLALMIIDPKNHKLMYSGAKRPLIMVRDGEVTEFSPDKICIGHNYLREHVKFTFKAIDTQQGDMFYAFSDGISDQFGGHDGLKFTLKRLKALLGTVASDSIENQKERINSAIKEWMGAGPTYKQIDDQLIIGFRV